MRQFIDSFPTVVSDYAQASGPAHFSEGKIMNGMRKSKRRKCDVIPAVQGTWGISPNDRVTVTLFSPYVALLVSGLKIMDLWISILDLRFLAVYHWTSYLTSVNLSLLLSVAQIKGNAVLRVSARERVVALLSWLEPFSSWLLCYVPNTPTISSIPSFWWLGPERSCNYMSSDNIADITFPLLWM